MSEELRDEIAGWLHSTLCSQIDDTSDTWVGATCDDAADALLSGPLAPLLEARMRVAALHVRTDGGWCQHCGDISDGGHGIWPCDTHRALDGPT